MTARMRLIRFFERYIMYTYNTSLLMYCFLTTDMTKYQADKLHKKGPPRAGNITEGYQPALRGLYVLDYHTN
jgi:hypothetical protein